MQLSSARRPGLVALGASVAVLAALLPMSAQAAPHPGPLPQSAAQAAATARTVTLITGDRVTVTPGRGDAPDTITVDRPAGAVGSVRTTTEGTDTYVYPEDAAGFVAAGLLDKRLFDVTGLLAQGYDDAHTTGLPLIVSHSENSALRSGGVTLPGLTTKRVLASVNGQAATAVRAKATALWTALTGGTGTSSGNRAAALGATGTPSFGNGVTKVWLDGKVKATLADTTAQIGAPRVWAEGNTGAGVRVAVLDTGIDAGHPDVEKRIVSSRSFVPGQEVTDLHGHGTHTASTVVGTGAASDGKERGVAPGADLIVGKVLDNTGQGTDSSVIAGMEWAAETEHAKVISMSLTDPARHDATDPMSESLNALSAETGALFVVAAGNSGQIPYSVGAPGVADSALTVGAVDSSDQLAFFSSSGPRAGDDALKPDLTAPGVDVLAARSQYSVEGEGYYTTMSGTSMAAPHVAGAAVLLAAQHPDWTGQQLKDTLMSTSRRTPYIAPYDGGSGRADVAAAVHAPVIATGSVFAGLIRWPHSSAQPVERHITYTNPGDEAVTLDLTMDRNQSPEGLFTLAADQVTVPAHDSSSVKVVADPAASGSGGFSAQVIARNTAAGIDVHTEVGISIESEQYNLVLTAKDRTGHPMPGVAGVQRASDGSVTYYVIPDSGTLTLRLPPGTYSAMMFAAVQGTHGPHSAGVALLGDPEVELKADATVAFDASTAREVRALTPKPAVPVQTRIEYYRSFTSAQPQPDNGALIENVLVGPVFDSIWAQPTGTKVQHGSFAFTTRWRAEQAPLDVSYGGQHLDDLLVQPGSAPLADGAYKLNAVSAGNGSAAEYAKLPARGRVAVVRRNDEVPPAEQSAAARTAGVKLLLVVNDGLGRLEDWYGAEDGTTAGRVPVASVTADEGEALVKKIGAAHRDQVRLRVESHPAPAYLYDLNRYQVGGIPADLTYRMDARNLARVDLTFGSLAGTPGVETRVDDPPYIGGAAYAFSPAPVAPGARTDWVSTDGGVKWQQSAEIPGWLMEQMEPTAYRAGSTQQDHWFSPVLRPRMTAGNLPQRDGDLLSASVPGWSDSGAGHAGYANYGALTQLVSLYQGDKLLNQVDYPSVYAVNLSPDKLPYRLVADVNGNATFSPYSSKTHTEWDFVSGQADLASLPLVQLDYGIRLDAAGKASRRADLSVSPAVSGTGAGGLTSVSLDVSYDAGASWQKQSLTRKDGAWRTTLHAPNSASFVSLRATANDRKAGSVSQTVVRAFGLK